VWHNSFISVTQLIHAWLWARRSYHTCEWVMSHIWMSHVTRMNESCHTHEWVVSHLWTRHVTHINEARHPHEWVTSHIRMTRADVHEGLFLWVCRSLFVSMWVSFVFVCWAMSQMSHAHPHESCHTHVLSKVQYGVATISMGWLRLVGSLKL